MVKMFKFFGNLTKSKRFWFAFIVFLVLSIIFTLGVYWGADPIALGTGETMIGTPLFGYLLGETVRPSGAVNGQKLDDTTKQQTNDQVG